MSIIACSCATETSKVTWISLPSFRAQNSRFLEIPNSITSCSILLTFDLGCDASGDSFHQEGVSVTALVHRIGGDVWLDGLRSYGTLPGGAEFILFGGDLE